MNDFEQVKIDDCIKDVLNGDLNQKDIDKVLEELKRQEFETIGDLISASDQSWDVLLTQFDEQQKGILNKLKDFILIAKKHRGAKRPVNESWNELSYETQKGPNTCFIHSINTFFQQEIANDTQRFYPKMLANLLKKAGDEKVNCSKSLKSFWADGIKPKQNQQVENCSDPQLDEDLIGYSEIYSEMDWRSFIEEIISNGFIELSPPQALFLLEFQIISLNNSKTNLLVHAPHLFLHRYANSPSTSSGSFLTEENEKAGIRFANALELASKKQPGKVSVFMCRVITGHSHALTARHTINDGWVILDSLVGKPQIAGSALKLVELSSSISILLIPDYSRPIKVLTSITQEITIK